MKRVSVWFAVQCIALVLAGHVTASELSWSDLPNPAAQGDEDPFQQLTLTELRAIGSILRLRRQLGNPDLSEQQKIALLEKQKTALARFSQTGMDPDEMLSQRRNLSKRRQLARTEGNPALDGKTAVLSGYVIPAPPDKEGRITAYLVPERGMCSHVPPPPPNKLVRLVFGEAWYPQYIYEPIQVKGRLAIEPAQRLLRVVDGLVNMQSTFVFQVSSVKTKPAKVGSGDVQQHWPTRPRS